MLGDERPLREEDSSRGADGHALLIVNLRQTQVQLLEKQLVLLVPGYVQEARDDSSTIAATMSFERVDVSIPLHQQLVPVRGLWREVLMFQDLGVCLRDEHALVRGPVEDPHSSVLGQRLHAAPIACRGTRST
ncbi:MAG: hypothetical protein ACYCYA_13890 [Actinomycetes bacterium]